MEIDRCVLLFLLLISENKPVVAVNNIWFIGDEFVNKIYHAYPAIKTEAKLADKEQPFVFEHFNIRSFTSKPTAVTRSVPAKILNCLIKALNENNKMPKLIVIIPDWDLLKFFNHNTYGVMELTNEVVTWMVNNMIWAIQLKKETMEKIKPGSIVSGEPKFIWVKMVNRLRRYEKILAV